MKIKSLYIENFQSIKKLKLDFRENEFLGIVGENNVGKTSIVRAVNLLATAAETRHVKRYYLRRGEKNLTIILETYEGDKITLVRGKDNYYLIEDRYGNVEEYPTNANSGVPDRILEILDLFVDQDTKTTYNIVTGANKLPLFNSVPSSNYKLVQKILNFDSVNDAMDRMKEDILDIDEELFTTQLTADNLKQQIESIDKELENADSLEKSFEYFKKQREIVEKIDKYIELSEQLEVLKNKYAPIRIDDSIVNKIKTLELVEKLINLFVQLQELENLKRNIVTIDDGQRLKIETQLRLVSKLQEYLEKYEKVNYLKTLLKKVEKPNIDLSKVEKLEKLLLNIKQKLLLEKELNDVTISLKSLKEKRDGLYKIIGYCPYCGAVKK